MIRLLELKESKQVVDDLTWAYDFDLSRANADSTLITLKPSVNFFVYLKCGTTTLIADADEVIPHNTASMRIVPRSASQQLQSLTMRATHPAQFKTTTPVAAGS
ncbi:hypothetical protein [Undibacterium curvum]|uniref:hypothetical protein n=1 Tax=Undibacterium curvum TaxID=2762294 RepID=UPI003D0DEE86